MPQSVWVALLGAEIKFVGKKYRTRIAEAGKEHPETLIMVHGGGGHLETFAYNVMPLSKHFHVIGLEMLNHGLSQVVDCSTVDFNAQVTGQVLDTMDSLGISRAWIHGEAGGASAITPLVRFNANRVKGVIFESGIGMQFKEGTVKPPRPPAGGIPMGERTLQLLKNPTWDGVKARLLMVMHYNHPERVSDELVDVRLAHYSRPSTNEGQRNYYSTSRVRPEPATEAEIARLRMPALVLWSDGSGGSGPDGGQRLASLIPGAQFKLLPETGYWGHWEKPDVFNEAVRQFISGQTVT